MMVTRCRTAPLRQKGGRTECQPERGNGLQSPGDVKNAADVQRSIEDAIDATFEALLGKELNR
jgi:hypothetical protein